MPETRSFHAQITDNKYTHTHTHVEGHPRTQRTREDSQLESNTRVYKLSPTLTLKLNSKTAKEISKEG